MSVVMSSSATFSPVQAMFPSPLASKRSSMASTTKSTLRASNAALIDMLQNIQAELLTHRSIMLDIQTRVSHLEQRPISSIFSDREDTEIAPSELPWTQQRSRLGGTLHPEGAAWWQACQNFARNSDPPISAAEFLRTPRPVSELEWQWEQKSAQLAAAPQTPPVTPPAKDNVDINANEIQLSPETMEIEAEVEERTVEVEVKELPPPPVLKSVPAPKTTVKEEEEYLAPPLEQPAQGNILRRFGNGQLSLATFEARFKHKKTDKEHIVLIRFHKASDLREGS